MGEIVLTSGCRRQLDRWSNLGWSYDEDLDDHILWSGVDSVHTNELYGLVVYSLEDLVGFMGSESSLGVNIVL